MRNPTGRHAATVRAWTRGCRAIASAVALLLLTAWGSPLAWADSQKVYVVTHVDVAPLPASAGPPLDAAAMKTAMRDVTAKAETLLHQLATESRQDSGFVSFQVLQEPQRRNHFTLVEVWDDESAFQAHEAAAHTRATREKLQPILGGPLDQRLHVLIDE